MSLDKYQDMRDFEATPEPAGTVKPTPEGELPRFVIQEHHATALHWDLRLERDGVLASWAVPKGIPPNPKQNHLAVHTEDHPLEYLEFHGDIPEGNYGAGSMGIWDYGTYETHEWTDRKVTVNFHGKRTQGRYAMFQTDGRNWMIHRMDPPQDPDWEAMPTGLRPMLPVDGAMPTDPSEYGFEIDWGGERALVASEGGRVKVHNVNGDDISAKLPEIRALGLTLGSCAVLLDGDLVALGDDGRPDHARLKRRLDVRSDSTARRLANASPLVFMVFDVLWLDGHHTVELPYTERRQRLADLKLNGRAWQAPANHVGEGPALLAAASAQGLPGVVAKKLDSIYLPGTTSDHWVRVSTTST
jgi:bifunctional non-homologous end joining protein LigD